MARRIAGKASPVRMRRQAKGQRVRFYSADGVDELFAIVTALTAEVSATNERLRSLEEALEQARVLRANAVEQHELPDTSLQSRLADREALIERVFQVLDGLVAPKQQR